MIAGLLDQRLNGCNPDQAAGDTRLYKCKPSNLLVSKDGTGGGWPTYWVLPSDSDYTVSCGAGPCPGWVTQPNFRIKIPTGAIVQPGGPDKHLTLVDQNRITGLKDAGREYDFYQADIDASAHRLTVTSAGTTRLDGNGITEAGGNTNLAGFGHLAGRIRIEELQAGDIRHAIVISIPCTAKSWIWPGNNQGRAASCEGKGIPQLDLPPAGQLLWLDITAEDMAKDPSLGVIPEWSKTILRAMNTYGAYVLDNGGQFTDADSGAFFQLQTEAQGEYKIINSDPWLEWVEPQAGKADSGWTGGGTPYVGALQGSLGSSDTAKARAWLTFWKSHLVAVDNCTVLPVPAGEPCTGTT